MIITDSLKAQPSLQHIRNFQWTPDIMTYDATRMVKSTSYYVQQVSEFLHMDGMGLDLIATQMFSVNRGTHVLQTSPVSSPDNAPLYWVASINNATDVIFLKV